MLYYDVVFIDADHTYGPVRKDITESLRLIKDGGIICGDDLNLQFHEVDKNNAKLNKDRQKQLKKDLAHFKKKSKK